MSGYYFVNGANPSNVISNLTQARNYMTSLREDPRLRAYFGYDDCIELVNTIQGDLWKIRADPGHLDSFRQTLKHAGLYSPLDINLRALEADLGSLIYDLMS